MDSAYTELHWSILIFLALSSPNRRVVQADGRTVLIIQFVLYDGGVLLHLGIFKGLLIVQAVGEGEVVLFQEYRSFIHNIRFLFSSLNRRFDAIFNCLNTRPFLFPKNYPFSLGHRN